LRYITFKWSNTFQKMKCRVRCVPRHTGHRGIQFSLNHATCLHTGWIMYHALNFQCLW
jgi:hypothetical protein